ncbi:dTMP kinase [Prochlorococcus sp. MIT 1223]|uniref:dTMP kinase n=1 Tax=Prochlorococcus sp. MIT 1223 TaxID=3096217 RepID=UPI002A7511D9|nr:dTMP kinase [Prochlorococcus sp. MIT 1223]
MKGRLIVLEGIDGCGKSTQIDHLTQWLPTSGVMPKASKLHVTREPGGTALGTSLRQILLGSTKENSPEPLTELLLYAADRAQHISQIILPALQQGDWVLSDRFSASTTAYQGYGRNIDMELIRKLEEIATQGISPDLTIWLDIEIEKSFERRVQKSKDRIEAEGKNFLEKVAFGFGVLATERNWLRVSADNECNLVSTQIEKSIKKYFENL